MAFNTDRRTVDLSAFPDLVVIYLGMRVNEVRGSGRCFASGPRSPSQSQIIPTGCSCTRI
jgi:hypothetical protein